MSTGTVVHRSQPGGAAGATEADPITTEIVRHGLNSAAEQMKRALIRTAFSPVIYEMLDFVVAIYDRQVRLLAQAPTLPLFMGTMNFCVEAAVEAVGGEEALEPGDILFYNWPFGSGSHPNDMVVVMPVFLDGEELIGYATVKGHWLDIAGKDPYSTDTVDVFQEGVIFPGVKLYSRGELVRDIYRIAQANSRLPKAVSGDINAQVVAVRTGATAFQRLVERHGLETFQACSERMFDHGEAIVRAYFEQIPDGRYTATGTMDDDGVSDDEVPFEVIIEVEGSTVRVDFSNTPDSQTGPINCPLPCTVSASRVAILNLVGGGESPNEGHFRALEVATRPGSMFHPLPPAPTFLFGWPALQAIEVIYPALAEALPEAVPACSGGDICWFVWWGTREATGEPWADGCVLPIGKGAHAGGDGANSLIHLIEAATRVTPTEVWEAKNPFILERVELAPDSGGAGEHRGGLGVDYYFEMLEDGWLTSTMERTKNAPWGIAGGGEGRPNGVAIRMPDGSRSSFAKATRRALPKGSVFEVHCGGGGGYGDASRRDPADVLDDLREGYMTEAEARRLYPHAFTEGDG
jgi:N-methylhydantoinase B